MRHPLTRWILVLGVASTSLVAQSAPRAPMGRFAPVSDLRSDWLDGGIESPNGRFYLLDSYAANDSGFLRYDRQKRSWAHLGSGNHGNNPRWSPNGRFVAYIRQGEESRDRYVWILPIDTATGLAGGPSRRVSTRPGVGPVAWSPDARSGDHARPAGQNGSSGWPAARTSPQCPGSSLRRVDSQRWYQARKPASGLDPPSAARSSNQT